jgi:hypothetical protein
MRGRSLLLLALLAGGGVGTALPVVGRTPPESAPPPSAEPEAVSSARLSGAPARPAAPFRPEDPVPSPTKEDPPPADLPSPQREWAAALRGVPDHPTRMERLLGVAATFAARDDLDNEDRTLLHVVEHADAASVFSQRARLQRAWHAQKKGDLASATIRAEDLARDDRTDPDVRAQAAYATTLFAYGLEDWGRARAAASILRGSTAKRASPLIQDVERRLADLFVDGDR